MTTDAGQVKVEGEEQYSRADHCSRRDGPVPIRSKNKDTMDTALLEAYTASDRLQGIGGLRQIHQKAAFSAGIVAKT